MRNDMRAFYDSAGGQCVDEAIHALRDHNDPFATPDGSVKDGYGPLYDRGDDVANQHTQLMKDNEITYDEGHAQPLGSFDGHGSSRDPQVVRKVNSNFQILRPGTFDVTDEDDIASTQKEGIKDGEKRVSRKLQKRGRASSKSSYTLEK